MPNRNIEFYDFYTDDVGVTEIEDRMVILTACIDYLKELHGREWDKQELFQVGQAWQLLDGVLRRIQPDDTGEHRVQG